ncbi:MULTISPECIES: 3-hydroxyacyl-ACP dehydratase FabZ [Pandoraea]|uniref:3-hydroxyacyl-[acyl-carrier-protein] dehydratase FabZ n=1 Tax=Pandoraea thiooxydans TaxID=445709 RepID=A0A0G3EQA2_9BURK|nr:MULTISPECIES: 3-hydroxyacyl-ACP dehydratase FabZ [Pandoraea]MBU6491719.1 3-hydroxyacyl-ACP dehydratase FabZ [Burkholderiales bacterium]AKJ68209.1 3-hydroxyacyl-[acyl-carrier-protein] dehydratase FabZ [Pandoraea thiooxydans]APR95515.1 3-hydroxyacyl-ACP dehydratase [Pandoraea thiooxydans]MDE2288875.1 3-hydroxyacyl-ACP dehydratase FabZ [Burkholderiales bacterium]MDE2609945.1 3-hydroxyacyl-ACP dehydratase FabZ [Burkholderiales bacterium]
MNQNTVKIDIHQILKLLPHRYPMLLVDRVIELEPHKSITAIKNVTINEPFFTGHYPQRPVMPGVLIIEALAQTAALLTFSEDTEHGEDSLYYFVGIDGARFKRPVEPGDQMVLHVDFERFLRGIWKFKGRAMVDGVVAAEAEFMCMIKKNPEAN